MNDIDEVAIKLNQIINYLNDNGACLTPLCHHWDTDFDDYGDFMCNQCGAVLESGDNDD